MKHGFDDIPVACCLTSAELREREATLLAQFRFGTERTPGWVCFPRPRRWQVDWIFGLIAELIVAERECCPFLAFEVAAPSPIWGQ